MSNTEKYKLVRGRVLQEIATTLEHYDTTKQIRGILADRILADPDILIKSDDQEPPDKFVLHFDDADIDAAREINYKVGQGDMLSAGFVRVEPREAKK